MLQREVKEVYGAKAEPGGIGGQTVAAHFREAGIPAAVWMTAFETAHQANEICSVEFMVGDAQVFAGLFARPIPPAHNASSDEQTGR
jgi:succinyl-diaminopimelate desuccinylase